jgi:hypothetical protein
LSNIATARVQPAEAARTFTGKQTTLNPFAGRDSRLCSFSRWQYPISRPALCPSQIKAAFLVCRYRSAVYKNGASQVLADAAYGTDTKFREELSDLELCYVVGIMSSVTVWKPGEGPLPAATWKGMVRL